MEFYVVGILNSFSGISGCSIGPIKLQQIAVLFHWIHVELQWVPIHLQLIHVLSQFSVHIHSILISFTYTLMYIRLKKTAVCGSPCTQGLSKIFRDQVTTFEIQQPEIDNKTDDKSFVNETLQFSCQSLVIH